MIGVWCSPKRPRYLPHMDTKLSHVDISHLEELDEEFDTFPSSKLGETLKTRYDRLRGIEGRMMIMIGDLATRLERVNALVSWRDPRATLIFLVLCVIARCVVYVVHLRHLINLNSIYVMRHSIIRVGHPSIP